MEWSTRKENGLTHYRRGPWLIMEDPYIRPLMNDTRPKATHTLHHEEADSPIAQGSLEECKKHAESH